MVAVQPYITALITVVAQHDAYVLPQPSSPERVYVSVQTDSQGAERLTAYLQSHHHSDLGQNVMNLALQPPGKLAYYFP